MLKERKRQKIKMITIKISKTHSLIELSRPAIPIKYFNFYIDGKIREEKQFSFYQLLSLDELLNAKSISLEYVKRRKNRTNLPENML